MITYRFGTHRSSSIHHHHSQTIIIIIIIRTYGRSCLLCSSVVENTFWICWSVFIVKSERKTCQDFVGTSFVVALFDRCLCSTYMLCCLTIFAICRNTLSDPPHPHHPLLSLHICWTRHFSLLPLRLSRAVRYRKYLTTYLTSTPPTTHQRIYALAFSLSLSQVISTKYITHYRHTHTYTHTPHHIFSRISSVVSSRVLCDSLRFCWPQLRRILTTNTLQTSSTNSARGQPICELHFEHRFGKIFYMKIYLHLSLSIP